MSAPKIEEKMTMRKFNDSNPGPPPFYWMIEIDVTFFAMQWMISWWVNTVCYYLFFDQTPILVLPSTVCWSCSLLGNPFEKTFFFNGQSLYVYYLVLLFLYFLKFLFFTEYSKYVIVPGLSYATWNSLPLTFFAIKND